MPALNSQRSRRRLFEQLLPNGRHNGQYGPTHDDHTHEIRNAANDPRYEVHFPPLVIAKTLISNLNYTIDHDRPIQGNKRRLQGNSGDRFDLNIPIIIAFYYHIAAVDSQDEAAFGLVLFLGPRSVVAAPLPVLLLRLLARRDRLANLDRRPAGVPEYDVRRLVDAGGHVGDMPE